MLSLTCYLLILRLLSDIDPIKALGSFNNQRDSLTLLLQRNLTSIANKLLARSIISDETLDAALNPHNSAKWRTVSLLNTLAAMIKAKPQLFIDFVKILESEPPLQSLANELVLAYQRFEGM